MRCRLKHACNSGNTDVTMETVRHFAHVTVEDHVIPVNCTRESDAELGISK